MFKQTVSLEGVLSLVGSSCYDGLSQQPEFSGTAGLKPQSLLRRRPAVNVGLLIGANYRFRTLGSYRVYRPLFCVGVLVPTLRNLGSPPVWCCTFT
jgi:hypothetical protein